MRRGIQQPENLRRNLEEYGHRFEYSSKAPAVSAVDTKKLRKMKDLESETRCHSARSPSRDSRNKAETSRTRSVSPGPYIPPVDIKLPLDKFYKLYSKIVLQLETVKNFTENKANETENLIDLRRQLQRADEFSIRFSRNNLYETKRIINEIKQLIVPYPFEGLSPGDCKVLCKKLILAYQAASQSLQTYINYAKNPSHLEVPDKINELILLIADLFLCCEHLSLPADEVYIQNDAVKVCNELMNLLKSKVPVVEYVEQKEADLAKKKASTAECEVNKMKKLSMYRKKLTPKVRAEPPKKLSGTHCLLGARARKMKKSEEMKARITHEIYTQKMNPRKKELGCRAVKFESENHQKEGAQEKVLLRRPRYMTPREVRSQDDDVETMVQTIGNDDVPTSRLGSTCRELDQLSVTSTGDKNNFKELLLEALEELKNSEKKDQKSSLKKLLSSIQNCSKTDCHPRNPERVKVFHFVSPNTAEEEGKAEPEGEREKQGVDSGGLEEEKEEKEEEEEEKRKEYGKLRGERKGKVMFRPLSQKKGGGDEGGGRGRVKLKLPEEVMTRASKYRKAFSEYRKNNIMYKKTLANKPWELVDKISDRIILEVIKEISLDFQNDAMLRRLYLNELQVLS